ncbi:MAG: hypothetical protein LWY06_08660 [Firmicutes bacterium]|nr:hypothetical protein [Bacillota bacterium]
MKISESFNTAALTPPSAGIVKKPETNEVSDKFPIQADKFKETPSDYQWVSGADLSTYKKVCSATGAASLSIAGHIAMPVGFGAAGAVIGGIAGAFVGGPVGAIAGKVIGGAAGAYAGVKVQAATEIGKKIGARMGHFAGKVLGLFAKTLGIPLRSDHIEETKNYSYDKMITHLDDSHYSNHARISEKDALAFMDKIKPGDIVLTNDESGTLFSIIVGAVDGKADFNHALLNAGNGKTIESRTVTDGVAEGDMKTVLMSKHHAIAIRPHYTSDSEAQDVVDAARGMIGTKYDFRFRMGDDSMYCSEMVFKAVKKGAPEIQFHKRPLITREVILPSDFLRTKKADVVAEAGKDNSIFNAYLARFV